MIDYLTVDDLIEVARRTAGDDVAIRDAGLLASAVGRPRTTVFGQDAYPGIWEKAAAVMESMGRNHALVDGNKRLAWTATWLFLGINGHELAETLDEDAAERFVIDVVTGKLEIRQIATVFSLSPHEAPATRVSAWRLTAVCSSNGNGRCPRA